MAIRFANITVLSSRFLEYLLLSYNLLHRIRSVHDKMQILRQSWSLLGKEKNVCINRAISSRILIKSQDE